MSTNESSIKLKYTKFILILYNFIFVNKVSWCWTSFNDNSASKILSHGCNKILNSIDLHVDTCLCVWKVLNSNWLISNKLFYSVYK